MLGINQARFSLPQYNVANNQSQPQLKLQTLGKDTVCFKGFFDLPISSEDEVIKALTRVLKTFNSDSVQTVQAYSNHLTPDNERINTFLKQIDWRNVESAKGKIKCLGRYLGKFDAWQESINKAGY